MPMHLTSLLCQVEAGVPLRMWSKRFTEWWGVHRLLDVTNLVFLRHFRGTLVLNWFYNVMVRPCCRCCW